MKNKMLTDRQQEIYDWTLENSISILQAPTYRDIAKQFGISVKGAFDHISAMRKKIELEFTFQKRRDGKTD